MWRLSVFFFFAAAVEVPLVTVDGVSGSVKLGDWECLIDPVMGGQSVGSWTSSNDYGTLDGEVKDVPSLAAPGFVTAGGTFTYPDVSKTVKGGLALTVRSSTSDYKGFRVSFAAGAMSPAYSCAAGGNLPFSRGCFKADFSFPENYDEDEFTTIYVPFTSFSDKWSSSTGKHGVECTDDPDVCPTAGKLKDISYVEVWAEGVDGKVHLDVAKIAAVASADAVEAEAVSVARPIEAYDADAFVGRWYQTHASLSVLAFPQLGGRCVTADYKAVAEGVLAVKNTVRVFDKLPIVVSGFAVQNPATSAGELQVMLGPNARAPGNFTQSNYWIVGLGPKTQGVYDWATVSEPTLKTLYVLARNASSFTEKYEAGVLAQLEAQGFSTALNKPRQTQHDEKCVYV
ncbi:hypothetical protein M885DRAFT_540815 [Pelagophyceae sp. CCMP2097]|nr:hypothetical protein M885DRAFT_540815 [Pelagophyceae sp. CCMP2097]